MWFLFRVSNRIRRKRGKKKTDGFTCMFTMKKNSGPPLAANFCGTKLSKLLYNHHEKGKPKTYKPYRLYCELNKSNLTSCTKIKFKCSTSSYWITENLNNVPRAGTKIIFSLVRSKPVSSNHLHQCALCLNLEGGS